MQGIGVRSVQERGSLTEENSQHEGETDSTNKNEHKWITSGTCEHAVNREGNPHQPHTTQEQAPPSSSALSLDTKGMKS